MDRRELLKVLSGGVAGLPAVRSIERLELRPDDAIVLTYDAPIKSEAAQRLREAMEQLFPGRKVLVLDSSVDLQVLRNA